MINEMQRDALSEIFNIAVGRAASILSEITNRKIELSVSNVELLSGNNMDVTFLNTCIGNCYGHIMSSSVKFGNEYNGKAFLLFPSDQAKILVSLCLNEIEASDSFVLDENRLLDTDFDVMKEIGNIILNSVVGGLGNLLATKLVYSLPEVETFFVSPETQAIILQNNIYILALKTLFSIANTQFRGAILIIMGMDSINQLISKIDDMLE
jgi:chemotaxis protein CheC